MRRRKSKGQLVFRGKIWLLAGHMNAHSPIQIDNVAIHSPVFLAPMTGVSDLPFRRLVKRFGAGLVVSEMIASRAMLIDNHNNQRMTSFEPSEFPFAMQLAGCDPEVMAEAAKMNEDKGAQIIDINFGCPVKKVVNSYAGSALMKDEPLAGKILEAVVKAVKIPVTLKMRMGWDHSSLNAPKMAKMAQDTGIKMITVHGRTRCQMYKGSADWEFIKSVKDAVTLPVIANGDIVDFESGKKAILQSGANGVMVGRGSYGRPWFLNQLAHYLKTGEKIAAPDITVQRDIVLEHYDHMLSHYGVQNGVMVARKHIGWYSGGLKDSAAFRQKVNTMTNPTEVKQSISEFYDSVLQKTGQGSILAAA